MLERRRIGRPRFLTKVQHLGPVPPALVLALLAGLAALPARAQEKSARSARESTPKGSAEIFADGFESGTVAAWTRAVGLHTYYWIVDLRDSQFTARDLYAGKGIPLGEQLPANHPIVPDGFVSFLAPEHLTRLRELGIELIDPTDYPSGAFPTGGGEIPLCFPDVIHDQRFCRYSGGSTGTCSNPIDVQLGILDATLPPGPSGDYFEVMDLGTTEEGRKILAARVGRLSAPGPEAIPQIVVVAAQHAQEWITVEVAMGILKHFAYAYTSDPAVRALLSTVALTVLPVANPDGRDFTFPPSPFDRHWRNNRHDCGTGSDYGVDPNRNLKFTFYEPGHTPSCGSRQYRGPSPGSEPESVAFGELAAGGPDGRFGTAAIVNYHSYGSLVVFAEGLSVGFSPCTTDSNCSSADLGAAYVLGGTRRSPRFINERGTPYSTGQTYRVLYDISGDLVTEGQFGNLPLFAPNAIGMTIELGDPVCGFDAERFIEPRIAGIVDQQIDFVRFLLDNAQSLFDGSYYDTKVGSYALPHIHRRDADIEHPTLRMGARKTIPSVDFFPENGDPAASFPDDVIEGVAYRSWAWRPSGDPFTFPRRLTVCAQEAEPDCASMRLGGGGGDPADSVDLCSPVYFTGVSGWTHVGRAIIPTTPMDQCFWQRDGSPGVGPWTLERGGSLAGMRDSTLVFSRSSSNNPDLAIKVTTTDFTTCDVLAGSDCRIVYDTRPDGVVPRRAGFRTEIVDISDFDGLDVMIRFELTGGDSTVRIYDPVVLGWEAP